MIVQIKIEDVAIRRLPWKDLKELVDHEYTQSQENTLRVLKTARREFGLEVSDGEGTEGDENNQPE